VNLKDEDARTTYVNGTVNLGVNLYGELFAFEETGQTNYSFCLSNIVNFTYNADILYHADIDIANQSDYGASAMRNRDYFIRDYFFNGSAPEIDLFMLKTLDGTAALAEV